MAAADELALPEEILTRVFRCSADTERLYRVGKSLVRAEIHIEAAEDLLEVARLIRSRVGHDGSPSEWIRTYQHTIGEISVDLLGHDWGIGDLLERLRGLMPKPCIPMADFEPEPAIVMPAGSPSGVAPTTQAVPESNR